jgi:hypothetical protein
MVVDFGSFRCGVGGETVSAGMARQGRGIRRIKRRERRRSLILA